MKHIINPFLASHDFCHLQGLLMFLAYIANRMDLDQTASTGSSLIRVHSACLRADWSGSILFASIIKSSLKCTWIYAADVKRRYFQDTQKQDITRLQSMVHHRKYLLLSIQSICKVWNSYVQPLRRRCIYKKVHYFTFDLDLRSQTNMKPCPVSSTSYDRCTCKVWSCYVQLFRGKCIYKKYLIWPWPRSRSHEALPSCDLCTCKV